MTVRIDRPIQGGAVRAIASKSEAHRLLICAALPSLAADAPPGRECFVDCQDRSEDIDATARCLKAMGADLRYEDGAYFVRPIDISELPGRCALDCGESASTLRFLLPLCGALGLSVSFVMRGRLSERPLSSLRDEMISHGYDLTETGRSPLICEGRLNSGTYTLPGDISSQFVSGLLFALPLLKGESIIRVRGVLESRPYVDMTLDALRLFGIKVSEDETGVFCIPGSQTAFSPARVKAAGDWSNAAFWLAAGAIGSAVSAGAAIKREVTCTGLDLDSRQGDRVIVELLERFGASLSREHDAVTVSPGVLRGMEIDAADIPDLVPVLAALASVAEGRTVIRNARRLRMKESDRLHTVAESLSSLGADIRETEDGLVIDGKKTLAGGETQSYGDHRIAMCAAVLSGACAGPVLIRDAEAVRKSYPAFFEDFNAALGGVCIPAD